MIPVVDNLELVKKEEVPVIVWFTVPGCPPCRAIEPRVKEFTEGRKGEFKIYKFDITKNPTVPQELEITSTPPFIFLSNGDEVDRLDGFPEVKEFEEILETAKKEVKT